MSISAQLPESAQNISPLLIGETIGDVTVKAPDASSHSILDIISKKPTIILVYRGGWCPYCNIHLSEIRDAESEIIKLGYQIVAISPDSPQNLLASDEKLKLGYSLYSDADGKFSKAMGIAFKAKESQLGKLSDKSDGLNEGYLPVPSVFITNTSGEIIFEYINPSYKRRLSAKLLLAILNNLD